MKKEITDAMLLKQASSGNRRSFAELYKRHFNALYYFLHGLTKQKTLAEDLAQDIFVKILRQKEKCSTINNFRSYLLSAGRKMAINMFHRERSKFAKYNTKFEFWAASSADNTKQLREQNHELNTALNKLPTKQREVLLLHIYEQMTFDSIALICSCPVKTAESRYRLAIAKMKRSLQ